LLISERHHAVHDLIKPPDLNQARVNKCLIALVNRKVVQKESSTVCDRRDFLKENPCPHGSFFRAPFFTTGGGYCDVPTRNTSHVTLSMYNNVSSTDPILYGTHDCAFLPELDLFGPFPIY